MPPALSTAAGLGSVWHHAAPGDAAPWAHDLTLYALALVGPTETVRRIAVRRPPVLASVIFIIGLAGWISSRTRRVV